MPALARVRPSATSLFRGLYPLRRASPERVAMLGTKKTKMADLGHAGIGGRDGENFRLGRCKSRTQKFDRRPRRPGIVGKAQRAHRPAISREILHRLEL